MYVPYVRIAVLLAALAGVGCSTSSPAAASCSDETLCTSDSDAGVWSCDCEGGTWAACSAELATGQACTSSDHDCMGCSDGGTYTCICVAERTGSDAGPGLLCVPNGEACR